MFLVLNEMAFWDVENFGLLNISLWSCKQLIKSMKSYVWSLYIGPVKQIYLA